MTKSINYSKENIKAKYQLITVGMFFLAVLLPGGVVKSGILLPLAILTGIYIYLKVMDKPENYRYYKIETEKSEITKEEYEGEKK